MAKEEDVIIFEQLKNFTTFRNPNNFDDYFALVLPTLSK
jgi:hypothetical protein